MKNKHVYSPGKRKCSGIPRVAVSWGLGFVLVYSIFLLNSCFEPELEPLNFFTVTTNAQTTTDSGLTGQVMLNGTLLYDPLGPRLVEDHGFFWSTNPEDLATENANREVISLGSNTGNSPNFTSPSPIMGQGVTYFYQAFAQEGERLMRGELREVSYAINTQLLQLERQNDSILLRVGITGLAEAGLTVQEFDLVIAKDNPPATQSDGDIVIHFGPQIQNFSLDTLVGVFEFNSTYYANTYYKGAKEEWGAALEITITDGWTRLADLPFQLHQATAVMGDEEAFILGGRFTFDDRNAAVLRFNPSSETTPWSEAGFSFAPFEQGLSVVWNNEIYYWEGLQESPSPSWFRLGAAIPVFDYCDPTLNFNYYNGVAFSLGERFYFGTGRNYNGQFTDQFWEVSLTDDCTLVRPVKPLPVTVNGAEFIGGRQGAVSFVLDGELYVGGGRGELIQYRDLYRFTPPPADDPTALGSWEFVDYLPGPAREEAVAFVADNRAFFGTGFNPGVGYFIDMWEYNPAGDPRWLPREPSPGVERAEALGLGINDQGYLIGGYRQFTPDGVLFNPEILRDVWSYTPKSN